MLGKQYKSKSLNTLTDKNITIIGYGSQGRAQALNLRDSGCHVSIGLRDGSQHAEMAHRDEMKVELLEDSVINADIIALLTPDETHKQIYHDVLEKRMPAKSCLLFAHGFSIQYKQVAPRADIDVLLVAPKGVGPMVRSQYEAGSGVAALIGVEQNVSGEAEEIGIAYAVANGCHHTGIFASTFKEETEADLFSEQAVLCGGVVELIKAGFETLIDAGYAPEVAYFECMHELKLIVDLLHDGGLKKMYKEISPTAAFGGLVSGERVIDKHVKKNLQGILEDIQSGEFARAFLADSQHNNAELQSKKQRQLAHLIENTRRTISNSQE